MTKAEQKYSEMKDKLVNTYILIAASKNNEGNISSVWIPIRGGTPIFLYITDHHMTFSINEIEILI